MLLFASFTIYSQEKIQIDSLFSNTDAGNYLSYYHDSENLETIASIPYKNFTPFNKKNFPGLYHAKFWFKLKTFNNDEKLRDLVFQIKAYAFFEKLNVYKIENGHLKKIYTQKGALERSFEISTQVQKKSITNYIFEVHFLKAVHFPIQLYSQKNFQKETTKNTIYLGLYYGFSALILLVNLLFFFFTKNKFFLYYTVLQAAVISSLAYLDGFYYYLFGDSIFTKLVNILGNNIALSLGGMLFIYYALALKKTYPWFKYVGAILFCFTLFPVIIYAFTYINFWYVIGKISYLLILLLCFTIGLLRFRKDTYARFYVLAQSILLASHILFIVPVLYGTKDFHFTEWHYKIGSTIEMIVFLIAIPYRHIKLDKRKKEVEKDLLTQQEVFKKEKSLLKKSQVSEDFKNDLFIKKYNLSTREVEVLNGILEGKSNKDISEFLHLTPQTIKYHCSKLYVKTDIKNRNQLTALYNLLPKD